MNEVINSVAKVYDFKGLYRSRLKMISALDDATLTSYVGDYQISPQLILTVTKIGNQLYSKANGQPGFHIFAETQNKFFPKEFEADLEFVKDENGQISKMILHQNGKIIDCKKIR